MSTTTTTTATTFVALTEKSAAYRAFFTLAQSANKLESQSETFARAIVALKDRGFHTEAGTPNFAEYATNALAQFGVRVSKSTIKNAVQANAVRSEFTDAIPALSEVRDRAILDVVRASTAETKVENLRRLAAGVSPATMQDEAKKVRSDSAEAFYDQHEAKIQKVFALVQGLFPDAGDASKALGAVRGLYRA